MAIRSHLIRAAAFLGVALLLPFVFPVQGAGPDPLAPPANRPGRDDPRYIALTGATVHATPDKTIENCTIVMRDGKIETVAPGAEPPAGAKVMPAKGLHIYAGFIDPYVEVDAPKPDPSAKGSHWNGGVTPQRSALDGKGLDDGTADALRKLGFTAAAISPKGGVYRGSAALVSLQKPDADPSVVRPPVYTAKVYQCLGFTSDRTDVGEARWSSYPSSQMGAIALIRQTLLDADYRQRTRGPGGDANCLDALTADATGKSTPLVFDVDDELEVLRAWKIADEFSRPTVVMGNGTEFRRLEAIASHKGTLIVPLNFPEKPRVVSLAEAAGGGGPDLRELMTWEQAPTNARRLRAAGLPIALTTHRLKDRAKFRENLRLAIRNGLSEADALRALTVTPATILGVPERMGTVEVGRVASLIVADGPIFDKKTKILDVYADGVRHVINAPSSKLEGVYTITMDPPPPGEARRFITIDESNAVTVRRAAKETPPAPKPPEKAAPAPDQPGEKGPEKQPIPPSPKPEAKPADAKPAEPAAPPAAPPAPEWKEKSTKARNVAITDDRLSFVFDHDNLGGPTGAFTMSGLVEQRDDKGRATVIRGDGLTSAGVPFRFTMTRQPESEFLGQWRISELDGKPKPAADKDQLKLDFTHTHEGLQLKLTITKEKGDPIVIDAENRKFTDGSFSFTHPLKKLGGEGDSHDTVHLEGDKLVGEGMLPDNSKHAYAAERVKADDDEPKIDVPATLAGLPFGAYAYEKPPAQSDVVFEHATIWTCAPGSTGPIPDGSLRIKDGKVLWIADNQQAGAYKLDPSTKVVDARGKHISPGIIDCHSHTGISKGVNESGQTVTAEVRIADVTNPDAMNWYRQLAGGVTTVNNLHGSANPIGGQNQVNKVRWGCAHPDDMHFAGAIPGIKFALGENVKWGNRDAGEGSGWRYPQTRMGVETMIRDRFLAAREYLQARRMPGGDKGRVDLELEALGEILEGKRLIHCHSYRQDEILALAHIAADFNFKLGTYQHILEGYKVADIVRDSSGGGSCFSDWWAYKVEVQDAIPQAGPIMAEQGIVVSFNSDSDEMARRLNVEASKGHKYSLTGPDQYTVSAEDALKFVTLNPAKQLRIDSKVGSLEAGKDADLVVWSGPPLSSLSIAERTFIDGREYWSRENDLKLRERDSKERQRITQKLLIEGPKKPDTATASGSPPGGPGGGGGGRRRPPTLLELMWQQADDRLRDRALERVRLGSSIEDATTGGAGTCGCEDR